MKITITRKIGNITYNFEISEDKDIDAFATAGFLASMPSKCELCKGENIHLSSNKAKGYTFVKMICKDCNARAQLGQYKDGGFFWKQWENYQAPSQQGEAPLPEEPSEEYGN